MAYATLITNENVPANFFVILKPRRQVKTWTLVSGAVYSASFDFTDFVSEVTLDGGALTHNITSSVLSSGEYFFDPIAEKLFVRTLTDGNPNSDFVVATFEVYVASLGRHWHRIPTDTTTALVYYEPLVARSPTLKQRLTDVFIGFLPVDRSTIRLSDPSDAKIFQKFIHDSSFNRSEIDIYHWLSFDLEATNIKKIFDGLTKNVTYTLDSLNVQTFGRIDEFTPEYRNPGATKSFYSTATFPNLDTFKIAAPVRYVYGVVDGFVPINIDFVDIETATTSDNRVFGCIGEQVELAEINASVTTGSTTTTTILSGTQIGIRVGDRCFFDRASGTDDFAKITNVSEGGGNTTLTHKDLTGSGGAMTSGDTVRRSFVASVDIIQQSVKYELQFNRDYTSSTGLSGGISGFTLVDDFEANHAGLDLFTGNDTISCRVYGPKNNVDIAGPTQVGGDDTESNNLTSAPVILLDILLNKIGISESRINTASFVAVEIEVQDALGFAIPFSDTGSFPKYKSILLDIMSTALLRLYLDNDLKWTLAKVKAAGTVSKTVADDEILIDSFSYEFDYRDIADSVVVSYAKRQLGDAPDSSEESKSVSADSEVAKFLHKESKQKPIDSLHFKTSEAQSLADKMSFILGDRQGRLSLKTKNRFFDTLINDTVKVSSARLPFLADFDIDTEQSRDMVVLGTSRGKKEVTLELDDQRGIEENSASFT